MQLFLHLSWSGDLHESWPEAGELLVDRDCLYDRCSVAGGEQINFLYLRTITKQQPVPVDAAAQCSRLHLSRLCRRMVFWQRGCPEKRSLNPSHFPLYSLCFLLHEQLVSAAACAVDLSQREGQLHSQSLNCTLLFEHYTTLSVPTELLQPSEDAAVEPPSVTGTASEMRQEKMSHERMQVKHMGQLFRE